MGTMTFGLQTDLASANTKFWDSFFVQVRMFETLIWTAWTRGFSCEKPDIEIALSDGKTEWKQGVYLILT